MRDAIVFTLVPIDTDIGNAAKARDEISSLGLNELRERASAAARPGQQDAGSGRRTFYPRCAAVRHYVFARAAGVCEAARKSAGSGKSVSARVVMGGRLIQKKNNN